jgi:hypothetical protein
VAVVRQAVITPQGGALEAPSGRVRVEFPPGAVAQDVRVRYVPQGRGDDTHFFVFHLEASQDTPANLPVIRFQRPLTLTLSYTQAEVEALAEDSLRLAYFDYDEAGHGRGMGRRTSMDDGSGSTSWVYDERGRVITETKVINGAGTFVTQWSYYADDQVWTMSYPGSPAETVTYRYNIMGLVESVRSNLDNNLYYVQSSDYDATGRVELRVLGNNVLRTERVYYPWTTTNGRGRLQQLKAGTPSNPTSLQDLRYWYDAVGNVTRIEDWKAGSPEALDFSYDDLDRLIGVSGAYTASYTYNEIGNITAWDEGTSVHYYYESGKPHAVTTVGVPPWYIKGSYSYDANGNMTGRTVNDTSYTLTYDAENRLTR